MSIFPTTRIGRALATSALVVGAVKIVPFLLQVFSLSGDERTELPPLVPPGTTRSLLLENPVTWFLAVALVVYTVLVARDLVLHWTRPAPPPRRPARKPAPRTATATRSAARPPRTAPRTTGATSRSTSRSSSDTARKASATKPTKKPAPRPTRSGSRTASSRSTPTRSGSGRR
jgi:cytoskeletal protein RodZ